MTKLLECYRNIDVSIKRVMKFGFRISFVLCLIATYILFTYSMNPTSHKIFDAGYLLIKSGIMFFVSFLIGAMACDRIKRELL